MDKLDNILHVFKHPLILVILGQAVYFTGIWANDVQSKRGLNWWRKNRPRMIATFVFCLLGLILDDELIELSEVILNKEFSEEFNWVVYPLMPILAERSHAFYQWALNVKLPIGR